MRDYLAAMDDWQPMAIYGLVAGSLAILSWFGDRRRMRRSNPDAVGFMPWTAIFFFSTIVACVTLGLAARDWFTA